jgi:hypothetical protein
LILDDERLEAPADPEIASPRIPWAMTLAIIES